MKYSQQERLDIGRRVYTKEMTSAQAQVQYNLGHASVENYVAAYKNSIGIQKSVHSSQKVSNSRKIKSAFSYDISDYENMSREELLEELIRAKVNEARAKKGYEVKGDGQNKVFSSISNRNSR